MGFLLPEAKRVIPNKNTPAAFARHLFYFSFPSPLPLPESFKNQPNPTDERDGPFNLSHKKVIKVVEKGEWMSNHK